MTEETPSSGSDAAEPVGGQRLAAARKARDISIFEIAKELHLDEHKVQALEENRFDILGAPVFAKGHLRKYAQLVGVDINDVIADYYTMNRAVGAPPVVGAARKRSLEIPPGPWLIAAALVVVLLAAFFLWPDKAPDDPPATETEAETLSDAEEGASPPAPAQDESVAESTPEQVDDEPVADAPEAVEPESTVAASPAPPVVAEPAPAQSLALAATAELQLTMRFSGDCWTEVTDAAGERLFFDLGRAGRTIRVSGEAPIRVLFGDSDNVELAVDGEPYPIRASMRRGRTARFTVTDPR